MNAKHQFKYTYTDTDLVEISPVEVTFDMPGEVTITQMLYNFESYLRACGFVFDGHLEVVPEGGYDLEDEESDKITATNYYKEQVDAIKNLDDETVRKAFNKACKMSDLDIYAAKEEVKKQKWVHGICNPPADNAKEYVEDCKATGKRYNSVDQMMKDLIKFNQ